MSLIYVGIVLLFLIIIYLQIVKNKNVKNDEILINKKPLTEIEQIAYWRLVV